MAGYSPRLPLTTGVVGIGYALTATLVEVVKQNMASVVLTIPGERIMLPDFGVGLAGFLFEQNTAITRDAIRTKIIEQVNIWMPNVKILNVYFEGQSELGGTIQNEDTVLKVTIEYVIKPIEVRDALVLPVGRVNTAALMPSL